MCIRDSLTPTEWQFIEILIRNAGKLVTRQTILTTISVSYTHLDVYKRQPLTGALTRRRRVLGFLVALLGGPALTALLTLFRSDDSITTDVLSYQLLVVVVALVGGCLLYTSRCV